MSLKKLFLYCFVISLTWGCSSQSTKTAEEAWKAEEARKAQGAKSAEDAWKAEEARKAQASKK